jgi:CDP-glycerol glycerophosphotransferase (TagB/SpsB family)
MKRHFRLLLMGCLRAAYNVFRRFSKVGPRLALFSSSSGANVFDSPYYMVKDLAGDPAFRIFVVSRRPGEDRAFLPGAARTVRYMGLPYLLLLARAGYLVTNSAFPEFFQKRPGQTLLNTWHGTPMKALGAHMPRAVRDMGRTQDQFLMADYLLYPNEFAMERIMDAFFLDRLYTGKAVLAGYPRNAAFFDTGRRDDIRREMGFGDRRVFVYMPTWRGESMDARDPGRHALALNGILESLDSSLAEDVLLYVKLHPYDRGKISIGEYRHIHLMPDSYEPYEFLNASDGLVSDYSSVIFDYAAAGREIILFPYDLEDYRRERGLYIEPGSLPFFIARDAGSLAARLNSRTSSAGNESLYRDFVDEYCRYDSADNARALNDVVFRGRPDAAVVRDFSGNNNRVWKIISGEELLRRAREGGMESRPGECIDGAGGSGGSGGSAAAVGGDGTVGRDGAGGIEGSAAAVGSDGTDGIGEDTLPLFAYEKFSGETAQEIRRNRDLFRIFAITPRGAVPYGVRQDGRGRKPL